jgi:hypothetical protein
MAEPSVLGAFAYPGHCLNVSDYGALDERRVAYENVKRVVESEGGCTTTIREAARQRR